MGRPANFAANRSTRATTKLEPAPQGMGAPPATRNTQGNDVEAHRCLPEGFLSPPRIHLMPATMVCVAYYTTRSHPDGGLRCIFTHRKQDWSSVTMSWLKSNMKKILCVKQAHPFPHAAQVGRISPDIFWRLPRYPARSWTKCACGATNQVARKTG